MEREKINEWIDRYNEGRLKGKDLEDFLRLLGEDPELRKEAAVDREINRMLEERELLEFRKTMMEARRGMRPSSRRWMLLAAAVLVLAMFGGYLYYRMILMPNRNGLPEKTLAGQADSLAVRPEKGPVGEEADSLSEDTLARGVPHKILLAERYSPDPSLESLVGTVTRGDGFRLITPLPSVTVRPGSDIRFTWSSGKPASVEIQVFDNKGAPVSTSEKIPVNEFLLNTASYEPGLYYWKLLYRERLATAGKIRIMP